MMVRSSTRVPRASLLERALGVFVVLALCLGAFLWAGRTLVQRHIDRVQLDVQRMAALRTFESAIVPVKTIAAYAPADAEQVRREFSSCRDPLREQARDKPARERTADGCANASQSEELACHLRAIDGKLAELGGNHRNDRERMLGEIYAVDLRGWARSVTATQAQSLATSAGEGGETGSSPSGARRAVSCHEAMAAAKQLAANDGRLLTRLSWRDLTARNSARTAFPSGQVMKVSERTLEQRNPWGGIPGCVYFGTGGTDGSLFYLSDKRATNRAACLAMRPPATAEGAVIAAREPASAERPGALDPAWAVPRSLPVILADLDNIRLPGRELYRAYTESGTGAPGKTLAVRTSLQKADGVAVAAPHGPNELERQKHKVEAGFNVHLTIAPDAQRIAQQVSACYAGDPAACAILGLAADPKFAEFTARMYEGAAVRMAAVAVIDVASGRIEALGSAHSECYRQEYDGPGRNKGQCPDLPTTPHYEPDRLLNHALYTDALPASTIKPIMALAFLHDTEYRRRIVADRIAGDFTRMQDELKSSDSAAFLDRMFCKDKGWMNCRRPADMQAASTLVGWDAGCVDASFRCGRLDVLFGLPGEVHMRPDAARAPLGASVIFGRLLTEPASSTRASDFRLISDFSFAPGLAASCSRGEQYSGEAKNHAWRKCREGHFSRIEHEGWGQGNARATAVGAAGMLARIAAAANGETSVRLPYLVDRITDSHAQEFELAVRQFHLADPVAIGIPQNDASFILAGMISHKGQGAPQGSRPGTANGACLRVFDAATCNRIDWIAGKTGTPPYGNDNLTLSAIRRRCAAQAAGQDGADDDITCASERPYKWYVAVFQTVPGAPGFNKAIAVLTERNWYKSGPLAGKVQSPGDHDELNVSAEIALRIMDRMRAKPVIEAKS